MSICTPTSPSTFYPDTPLGSGFNAGELVFASCFCHFLCALGELTQSLSTYILTLKCVNMDLVGLSMKHLAPVPHEVGSPWVTAVITKINKPNTLIWPFKLSVLLQKLLLVFDQPPPFPTAAQFSLSVTSQESQTLGNPMDCSMPVFPVHHQLLELAQTHVHWVGDAIQPPHPLSSPCLTFLKCSGWAILNMKKLWGAPMPAISLLLMCSLSSRRLIAIYGLNLKAGALSTMSVCLTKWHTGPKQKKIVSQTGRTSRCVRFLLWGIYEDSYHIYSSGERWSTCSILGSQGWKCFRYSSYLSIFLANYPEAQKARSHLLQNTVVCRITGLKSTWASSGPILHLGQWLSAPTGLQNHLGTFEKYFFSGVIPRYKGNWSRREPKNLYF